MAVTATFTLDDAAIRRLVTDPGGPVARNIHERARRVETRAKQLAPVDTGRLRSSIHLDGPNQDPEGISYDVVAATNYAEFVEGGTRFMAPRPFLRDALQAASG